MIRAVRIGDNPIIHQGLCPSLGDNINGPSLITRPDWAPGPGRFLLYFAHHKGQHIRLATADELAGPWTIHGPGVLPLAETPLAQTRPETPQPAWAQAIGEDGLYPHLASPDVWVADDVSQVRMLFHGLAAEGEQVSYAATSSDGLDWQVTGPAIADTYLRRFKAGGQTYALARLGILWRERPGGQWERGPKVIPGEVRHLAVLELGDSLHVVFSRIGDAPERLIHTALYLTQDWQSWQSGPETELLRPEMDWEGAHLPVRPSRAGATAFVHELRDPCLVAIGDAVWMVYSGGGEQALGLARIDGL